MFSRSGLGLRFDAKALISYPLARMREGKFRFSGVELPYFFHLYNNTHLNERAVEIPIVRHYLNGADNVMEIGNVLNHYGYFRHDVVDKFEKGRGVVNCDIRDFKATKQYDVICSISTMEHVGWDERPAESPTAFHTAHGLLRGLLAPGGRFVFTVPVGYNTWLDEQFSTGKVKMDETHSLIRMDRANHWREAPLAEALKSKYMHPFLAANALVVGVNYGI